MRKGAVLSDLHLFTDRSNAIDLEESIHKACNASDFIILNGDIFDFRWSSFPTTEETIEAAADWLKTLAQTYPKCNFYYVMGNHDSLIAWGERLKDNLNQPNFNWNPTHVKIGTSLFIHGDLPLAGKNPFERALLQKESAPPNYLNMLYNLVVALHIHRLADIINRKKRSVVRIHAILDKYDDDIMNDITDIYFGHTHTHFSGYKYGKYIFHNTGGAIKGVTQRILDIRNE